jgi:hypothetical protein
MEPDITTRLNRIETALATFQTMLTALLDRETVREWYTTEQFANLVGLAEFTVREHCRLGRLNAEKRRSGRGAYCSWVISHQELQRYQQQGLLPLRRPR